MTLKNADLIRAVLDGKTVQYRHREHSKWNTIPDPQNAAALLVDPAWGNEEFRLAPEPAVTWQVVKVGQSAPFVDCNAYSNRDLALARSKSLANVVGFLKLTHDPSTGEITAEVEKV